MVKCWKAAVGEERAPNDGGEEAIVPVPGHSALREPASTDRNRTLSQQRREPA